MMDSSNDDVERGVPFGNSQRGGAQDFSSEPMNSVCLVRLTVGVSTLFAHFLHFFQNTDQDAQRTETSCFVFSNGQVHSAGPHKITSYLPTCP